ncbi:MAG TPA: hypothetical protein VM618_11650, partial [Acidimicrobiia bacterium]|nr:hypothetical protein [Acidimicrobiia bacterium]
MKRATIIAPLVVLALAAAPWLPVPVGAQTTCEPLPETLPGQSVPFTGSPECNLLRAGDRLVHDTADDVAQDVDDAVQHVSRQTVLAATPGVFVEGAEPVRPIEATLAPSPRAVTVTYT